jgi:formylglycine-generating enzyme required for sulfatase activity
MADIFVSYRRDDSQWSAGRINDRLEAVFGAERVFFDTVTIRPGEDFHQVLGNRVGSCRVLLAVVGPRWLDILESRLSEPNDFVRIEIAEGLQRQVRVIPVLIDGARPPPAARLPDDLKALARLNAIPVRADTFRSDLDQLIGFLREYLDNGPAGGAAPQQAHVAQGDRIKVDAKIVHGAPEGLFKPGAGRTEWFKDLDVGPEMVVVPEGSFTMGSRASEIAALKKEYSSDQPDREGPQRTVTIKKPFAVGRFAVTFDEWDAAVADGGCNSYRPDDAGWGRGRRPVINVSWEDAKAYARWLAERTGKTYRLLSETEWEYCCRAGTTTAFWWGGSISTRQANYDGNHTFGGGSKGEYRKQTVPVDSFEPNPWGLYQVHGNVWEWCEDNWQSDYKGASQDGSVRTGGDVSLRVLRGGSWGVQGGLRSASRDWSHLSNRDSFIGFRVARTL